MARTFDLVLFGATGFTGRLVAEYLAAHAPEGLRWALAGRSRAKLEAVRTALAKSAPALASLPVLEADASDASSVREVAEATGLVVTTVGPYVKHGFLLASACAEAGTDCCDLTGEVPFVRRLIDECSASAARTGARLVPCCGFDSIPSDLGVFLLSAHLGEQGRRLSRARLVVRRLSGGVSGGTVASMIGLAELTGSEPGLRGLLLDPYALIPDRAVDRGLDAGDPWGVGRDRDLGTWTAPFLMAAINTRVVRRTNALLGHPYGKGFRYEEVMGTGGGPAGFARAVGVTLGFGAAVGLALTRPTRALLAKALPAPGQGPDRATREAGFFEIDVLGWTEGAERPSAVCHIRGSSDPGYGETAKMLSESALLLVATRGSKPGGVLTPAVAFGATLAERLRAAGMRWDVADR